MNEYKRGEIEGRTQILNITFGYLSRFCDLSTEEIVDYSKYVHNKLKEPEVIIADCGNFNHFKDER